MMYICTECGLLFDSPHMTSGGPDDGMQTCPGCGSPDIDDAVVCALCGKVHADDDMPTKHVCADCLSAAGDTKTVTEYAFDGHAREFLAYWLGIEERDITEYAVETLRTLWPVYVERDPEFAAVLCADYIGEYLYDFAEWLIERRKHG